MREQQVVFKDFETDKSKVFRDIGAIHFGLKPIVYWIDVRNSGDLVVSVEGLDSLRFKVDEDRDMFIVKK